MPGPARRPIAADDTGSRVRLGWAEGLVKHLHSVPSRRVEAVECRRWVRHLLRCTRTSPCVFLPNLHLCLVYFSKQISMETGAVCDKASVFHFALLLSRKGGAETYKGQMTFRQGETFQLPWPLTQTGAALASLGPALTDGRRRLRSTRPLLGSLNFGEDSMSGLRSPSSCPSWMEGSTVVLDGG